MQQAWELFERMERQNKKKHKDLGSKESGASVTSSESVQKITKVADNVKEKERIGRSGQKRTRQASSKHLLKSRFSHCVCQKKRLLHVYQARNYDYAYIHSILSSNFRL